MPLKRKPNRMYCGYVILVATAGSAELLSDFYTLAVFFNVSWSNWYSPNEPLKYSPTFFLFFVGFFESDTFDSDLFYANVIFYLSYTEFGKVMNGLKTAGEMMEQARTFMKNTKTSDIMKTTRVPYHVSLAASYGNLNSDSIKALDEELKVSFHNRKSPIQSLRFTKSGRNG